MFSTPSHDEGHDMSGRLGSRLASTRSGRVPEGRWGRWGRVRRPLLLCGAVLRFPGAGSGFGIAWLLLAPPRGGGGMSGSNRNTETAAIHTYTPTFPVLQPFLLIRLQWS